MHRCFVRLQAIGMMRIKGKVSASVLQQHPCFARDYTRSKGPVKTLNQGNRIALIICNRYINGIANQAAVRGHPIPGKSTPWIDQAATLRSVAWIDQTLHRHINKLRIGQIAIAVVIGNLLGLHEQVNMLGAEIAGSAQIEPFQYMEHLKERESLRRRWRLVKLKATVAALDRFGPTRLLRRQVLRIKYAALGC